MNKTITPSIETIERNWFLVDAKDKTLGRLAPEIFKDRCVNKKKNDVKESAPAKGLCFVNAVYEENVFKKINKNDFFPVFLIKGFS